MEMAALPSTLFDLLAVHPSDMDIDMYLITADAAAAALHCDEVLCIKYLLCSSFSFSCCSYSCCSHLYSHPSGLY